MNRTLATAVVTTLVASASSVIAAPSSLSVSYQNYRNGHQYTDSNFGSDMRSVTFAGEIGNGQHLVVNYPGNSTYKRLRIQFGKGKAGRDHVIARSNLSPSTVYKMDYRVRFADNFDFVRGGKLPGLSGGTSPSGGRPSTDGMSARFMWRFDNYRDGRRTGDRRNYIEGYLYWRGQAIEYQRGDEDRKFGDRLFLTNARKNQWYNLEVRAYLGNSSRDGTLAYRINGQTKYFTDLRYRDSGDTWKIDHVNMSFFYGGDVSWAPDQDTNLFFDNLRVQN